MAKLSTIVFPVQNDVIYLSEKIKGFGVGFLNGYGGKENFPGEPASSIAPRECKEEAGIDVLFEDLDEVAVIDFHKGEKHLYECHIYTTSKWKGEFQPSEEMAFPHPFKRDNLPFEKMWLGDKKWMPLISKGEKIRGEMWYNEEMTEVVRFEYHPL